MKPENADYYAWDSFVIWCDKNGVSLEDEEDYELWWNCWKTAYIACMNDR